jgi:hypothetical protein
VKGHAKLGRIAPREGGRASVSAVIAHEKRAIQYAAASWFNRRLPGVLDPRMRGDDEWWAGSRSRSLPHGREGEVMQAHETPLSSPGKPGNDEWKRMDDEWSDYQ